MQDLPGSPSLPSGASSESVGRVAPPVLLLHVREASASDSHENSFKPEKLSPAEERTPELVTSALPGSSFGSKRLHKNPNLNISIPPLAAVKPSLGLSPLGTTQDPMTPVFQIVHTPTTAPGAPGPGDPAEIRRLEESWAANMVDYDQISPAFPNFRPPTFDEFSVKHASEASFKDFAMGHLEAKHGDDSLALREMFALTASAKSPTFPPPSLALDFGKFEPRKMNEN
ncbi:hypothetical protein VP01_1129g6 [Puccinia sorghi]|uniref:Uncharacterized protein n=1 Tax=Puccinia sorghi TaxID=27349 RepID=A0A0L6VS81_9BASI|nr:hypothetical protein VP01_1129g6 [Puccinia sorghi]